MLWVFSWFLLALADLRTDLTASGIHAIFPGDQAYKNASETFNQRLLFHPAAITYPSSIYQLSEIIKIGTSNHLGVAARSGGHSSLSDGIGGRDGVLVIDMKNMTSITIDPFTGNAVIETGNRIEDIAIKLSHAGRGLGHGSCPGVGIGGHAGYGGFGFTSRMWGLTLDAIESINVVLANGSVVETSNDHNPDLFWAMRGSAPSFGIATSIRVKTFPVPPSVTVFSYSWNMSAVEVTSSLSSFQDFAYTNIPSELGILLTFNRGLHSGQLSLSLIGAWWGPDDYFNKTISPLLQGFPRNYEPLVLQGTYIQSIERLGYQVINDNVTAENLYLKSILTPEQSPMTNKAIAAFVQQFVDYQAPPNLYFDCVFELYGGTNSAVNAVAPNATSYAHRNSLFLIQVSAVFFPMEATFPSVGIEIADKMMNSIVSNSPADWDYGAYPNYADDHLKDWQIRYYGSHYESLQYLKRVYDPTNTFSFRIGISPA